MNSRVIAALAVSMLVCGCAKRSHLDGNVYRSGETSYRIGTLEGDWKRVRVDSHNELAWHNKALGALIQINSSCNRALDIPLSSLTNHLLIGFTERQVQQEELLEMDGREALQTHVHAKLDGVAREILLRVMKKNACVYDFSLVAPRGDPFATARASFETSLSEFGTLESTR